jgi:flagellar hook assembly protein FlgD
LNQIAGFLSPGDVQLKIFDVTGRVVKSFDNLASEQIIWDGIDENGRQVASGVYFVDLNIKGNQQGTKVVLLK